MKLVASCTTVDFHGALRCDLRYSRALRKMTIPQHMRVVALVLTLALFAPPCVRAQSDALIAAFNQYEALSEQGLYAEAEPFARKALELGTKALGPELPKTAALMDNLAGLYHAQDRDPEAEPLYKRALAIGESSRASPIRLRLAPVLATFPS